MTEGDNEVKNARDEKGEDEDDEADSPIPIDRGWAWMVVVGTYGVKGEWEGDGGGGFLQLVRYLVRKATDLSQASAEAQRSHFRSM